MKKIFTILLWVCCGVVGWAQTAVFVAADGNDGNNGSTWALAKKTIAAGITAAGTDGTVYVKAGSYGISAQLVIPAGVTVKGGYKLTASGTDTNKRELPGTNSRWENASLCTIISGAGNHRIASVSGLLEGCVLRRGYTNATGGGTYIDGGTVRYCVITECDAYNENTLAAEGGGAYILNGGTLTNSVVTECRADKGPAVSGGNGSLINNTITRNYSTHCGTVADFDGNVYTTVVIGQQCWTKQNLRATHYNDGTAIPFGSYNSDTEPYYYANYYAMSPTMLTSYGYLYNWPAAMHGAPSSNHNPSGVTGICPFGWHLPSNAEWSEMTDYVNSRTAYRCNGYSWQIAKALASKSGWTSTSNSCEVGYSQGANNATLFTGFPAGYFNDGYVDFGTRANWWTATEYSSSNARYQYFSNNATNRTYSNISKFYGLSVRCVKQMSNEPVVVTLRPSMVSDSTAMSGGKCWDGGSPITSFGVCWSTSPNPTIDDSHTVDGSGSAVFTSLITGLNQGDSCYVRAYAVNGTGVSYGEEYGFVVNFVCGEENYAVADFDGNQYSTVKIGNQCWMKENLRATHYANGDAIALGSSTSNTVAYRYYPNNNSNNVAGYGYLYNWKAVMHDADSSNANPSGVQGICPNGWHVPSHAEFTQLTNYLSSQSQYVCGGNTNNITKALASTTGWSSSSNTCAIGNNQSSNNATGFSAMPAGNYTENGSYGSFGNYTQFWSATEYNIDRSFYRSISYNNGTVYMDSNGWYKKCGYSVRCVRNEQ